jgi:phage terminase small subunit
MSNLTQKQEAFCIEVASGVHQNQAYKTVYSTQSNTDKTIGEKASRFMADPKIKARIAELRKPVIEKMQITLESHLAELARLRSVAEEKGQINAAITAETNRGKASGLYVDKVEANVNGNLTVEIVRFGKRE